MPDLMPGTAASTLCKQYLDRLPLTIDKRHLLEKEVTADGMHTPSEAMAQLHRALAGQTATESATDSHPAYSSVASRVQLSYAQKESLPLAPLMHRASMVPHPWGTLNPFTRWVKSGSKQSASAVESDSQDAPDKDAPDPQGNWQHNGNIRRIILLTLMLAQTWLATHFMCQVLPYQGLTLIEKAMLALFALLFCWVSAGFWTAMTGFLVLIRGSDRFVISKGAEEATPIDPAARTAIVMPICNENVSGVMAGLRATYQSIEETGELDRFDFFILSDSNDSDICTAEMSAWAELCKTINGFGRIFYRHRQRRVKRKSGNIDDFCRRWGKNYRYMIVLDADSVMSGKCVTTLVKLMEKNPGAGIIQTAPRAAGRETLYARIQQFASRVYGPLFTAGLHYWQLGESHYWGHNAIIRVAPFIRHCALAPLPGRGSLAGEILSHDFVEAALMRRAGWGVWIAYDLDGSYEEMPPNLLDELKRDRRWCHGNLMNFRLVAASGMHAVHRTVFITGVMAYLSAPLWFLFLALSTGLLALHTLVEPQYFFEPRQLFPVWPQWHPEKAIALFSATATLLFLPKLLSVLLVCMQGARQFGGVLQVIVSTVIELFFSMLLAPVRMLFHTRFVTAALLGWSIHWKSPPRKDSETSWGEAIRKHGLHTLLGLGWGIGVYLLNPSFLPWLLPIAGALSLSIPLSVWSSRISLGKLFQRAQLFNIPEETAPPPVLLAAAAHNAQESTQPGFVDAVIDPKVNALICSSRMTRFAFPLLISESRSALTELALRSGPDALTELQKEILLKDPLFLSQLHFDVWTCPDAHEQWRQNIIHHSPSRNTLALTH